MASANQEDPHPGLRILVLHEEQLSGQQHEHVRLLQNECFATVPYDELMEDFVAEAFARVLAYSADEPVGCVSVFQRPIKHAGKTINLGGFGGTRTREDIRGRGVGTAVCLAAMDLLRERGCDVAFLAVGQSKGTAVFYERMGFRLPGRPLTYVNAQQKTRTPPSDDVGMLAPVCSEQVFEALLADSGPLHLGPELGYW
jgi:GNAT superfamily N-acetyltransferase